MQQSPNGRHFVYNSEGVRAHAYKCAAGKWTIGVGHKIVILAEYQLYVELGKGLMPREIDAIYDKDVASKVAAVNDALKHCPFKLNQNQFDALVCFRL
jgi:lysozyme